MVTKDLPKVNNDLLITTDVHFLPNITVSFFTGSLTIYSDIYLFKF